MAINRGLYSGGTFASKTCVFGTVAGWRFFSPDGVAAWKAKTPAAAFEHAIVKNQLYTNTITNYVLNVTDKNYFIDPIVVRCLS